MDNSIKSHRNPIEFPKSLVFFFGKSSNWKLCQASARKIRATVSVSSSKNCAKDTQNREAFPRGNDMVLIQGISDAIWILTLEI